MKGLEETDYKEKKHKFHNNNNNNNTELYNSEDKFEYIPGVLLVLPSRKEEVKEERM